MKRLCFPPVYFLNPSYLITKRPSQKFIERLLFFIFCLLHYALFAQTGCSECVLVLPDSLQEDTFYLQEFPDGQFRVDYDQNVSYRLPTNTSQVTYLVPSIPAGVGIGELAIKSINNLPAGLSWEPSQKNYNLPDERDGCVRICGTPLQYGLFKLEITVTAQVSILSQDATFTRNIFIAPPSSANGGFTMTNNIGCGNTLVNFENNLPSEGLDGYTYLWNFGQGNSTTDENPSPQAYNQPGIYPVSYQAIIDTVGFILTEVAVNDLSCKDFLGKPDVKLRIFDEAGNVVFQNESIDNTNPPIRFPMNFKIGSGNYRLEVIDDDSGLGGSDDLCGSINFNQLSNGALEDGDLKVNLNIFHPVDTVQVLDSVIVYDRPLTPAISYNDTALFCEGDTLALEASVTASQIQWYKDSTPLVGAVAPVFKATQTGLYHLVTIDDNGCIAQSNAAPLSTTPLPGAPVLSQESNLLSIFNPSILPEDYGLRWFQEDNLMEHTAFSLCISETGKYGIELTNNTSGCSNYFESVYTYEENGICSTNAEDLGTGLDQVQIYPNPVWDRLTVALLLEQPLERARIRIINSIGQIIQQEILEGREIQLQMDLSGQLPGLYFVQITDGSEWQTWKVLKQ